MNMTICNVPTYKKYDVIDAGGIIIREYEDLMDISFSNADVKIDNESCALIVPNLEIRNRNTDRYFYISLLEVENVYLS